MRLWVTLVLSGSLAIVGCGENGSTDPRSSCLTDGAGGAGGVNPSSPFLVDIVWDPLGWCRQGSRNSYNIVVLADDPDTPLLDLIFDVNVVYGGHYLTETFGVRATAALLAEKFEVEAQFIDHPTGM